MDPMKFCNELKYKGFLGINSECKFYKAHISFFLEKEDKPRPLH